MTNYTDLPKKKDESVLDIASAVSSAVPWIGGPVSNVLGGISTQRKLNRVHEVLTQVSEGLKDFKSEASERYVQTEDFEELLENALRKVSEERNKEKRRIFANFLIAAVEFPGESYDEKIRFLRTLEELQVDHLKVLRALGMPPGDIRNMITGSPSGTLQKRLPEMSSERIADLISQLNDMRLTNLSTMNVMMTAHDAEDLRNTITGYGRRFIKYLGDA